MTVLDVDMAKLTAPGFTPLIITGIALVLLWLLWRNLQKQIKKIDVPVDMEHVESAPFATPEDDARAAAEATRGASRESTDHTA